MSTSYPEKFVIISAHDISSDQHVKSQNHIRAERHHLIGKEFSSDGNPKHIFNQSVVIESDC